VNVKLKAVVIAAIFALGVVTSVAVAKGPPPGKGKGKHETATGSTGSTGTTTTTADKHAQKKMWICHRTGSGKWVKMRINRKAWPAHKRHGDASLEAEPGSTGSTGSTSTTGTIGRAKGAGSCAAPGSAGSTTGTTTTGP
jgi:hypothetical protein